MDAQHRQGIVHRKSARNGQLHLSLLLSQLRREADPLGVQGHVHSLQIPVPCHRGGEHRAGRRLQNLLGIAVIPVYHSPVTPAEQFRLGGAVFIHGLVKVQMILRQVGKGRHVKVDAPHPFQAQGPVTPAEQFRLGGAVFIHGLVKVQMILRQVGKGRHVKVDAPHPFQAQGVAGNLHHHMGTAGSAHLGKQALQFQALRGGSLRGNFLAADEIGHSAHQAHLGPGHLLQHLLEQQRGGGFAVGAGNADHGHGVCRMVIKIAAHLGQSQPVRLHQHVGNLLLRLAGSDHHRCPPVQGHGDEAIAVSGEAGHRHKGIPGRNLPGIVAHPGNLRLQIRRARQHRHILEQILQFHSNLLISSFFCCSPPAGAG